MMGNSVNDVIWLNGEILPMSEARLGIEDRGFQFADGVYEVLRLYNGRAFAEAEHLARLSKSAAGISLSMPLSPQSLSLELSKLVAASGVQEGMIYLQLTRGQAPRNHAFPADATPTLLFYARTLPDIPGPGVGAGAKLISVADERWHRCWIKSIALLPNVLAKSQALAAGADEAVFVDHGQISECSASNIFAVIDGKLVTHPVGPRVLPGVTRAVLLDCARELDLKFDERPLGEAEARDAQELFITSTTREISWVESWDGRSIGNGRCGVTTAHLHQAIRRRIHNETGAYAQQQMICAASSA